jgi:hypothetical protein
MRRIAWPVLLMLWGLLAAMPAPAAPSIETDAGFAALFARYYGAVAKGKWDDAFHLLHDRLRTATDVRSPDDLARQSLRTQRELIEAFQTFDRLEVSKTELDLTSIKGHVTAAGEGDVAGELSYELIVFPKGPGRPRVYTVLMDVGLAQGRIIRMTQRSITRTDPGGLGDAV